ncbi:MAG: hypothetical protein KGM49_09165 [Sphingomonadales bacterium]|nr:hypothetical protein [Sphingomonadales bacterium]
MKANHPPVPAAFSLTGLAALALLSSCVAPKAPPPVLPAQAPRPVQPSPAPIPIPQPTPRATDWRDAAQTPGTWIWSNADGSSTARFSQPGGGIVASLSCDRVNGQVLLARQGRATGAVPLQITTSTGTQALFSEPLRSTPGIIVAVLRSRDPLLDAIAFSRGRFAFEATGEATLYLPSWPEISRVIEDCR